MPNIRLPKLKCNQCGYEWTPRISDVRICPNCKSLHWDKPTKKKTKPQ